MSIFEVIILALVQGITEFLPVSSSGHLVLAPRVFGFEDMGLGVSVVLHVGTLLAVLLYFWRDWLSIFQLALFSQTSNVQGQMYTKKTLVFLVISTIPAALAGFFMGDFLEQSMRNPLWVAGLIAAGAIILWIADKRLRIRKEIQSLTHLDVLCIGMAQVLALLPGISRSGITISVGMFLGLGRKEAARFSFLMATPIIIGAGALKIPEIVSIGFSGTSLIGVALSFLASFLTIRYMLRFIERVRYSVFVWYSFVLAFIIFLIG